MRARRSASSTSCGRSRRLRGRGRARARDAAPAALGDYLQTSAIFNEDMQVLSAHRSERLRRARHRLRGRPRGARRPAPCASSARAPTCWRATPPAHPRTEESPARHCCRVRRRDHVPAGLGAVGDATRGITSDASNGAIAGVTPRRTSPGPLTGAGHAPGPDSWSATRPDRARTRAKSASASPPALGHQALVHDVWAAGGRSAGADRRRHRFGGVHGAHRARAVHSRSRGHRPHGRGARGVRASRSGCRPRARRSSTARGCRRWPAWSCSPSRRCSRRSCTGSSAPTQAGMPRAGGRPPCATPTPTRPSRRATTPRWSR